MNNGYEPRMQLIPAIANAIFNYSQWRCNEVEAKNFIKNFIETYVGHGGQVENTNPVVIGGINDEGKAVETVWLAAGNQCTVAPILLKEIKADYAAKLRPQLLVFMVPNRSGYLRIKKSCDCRYGVVSQVMNNKHVVEAKGQYMSNVCMKVNAKLGGTTARVQTVSSYPWVFAFEDDSDVGCSPITQPLSRSPPSSLERMFLTLHLVANRRPWQL